jgi:UDP-N-acetylmuramyl-tripeptide synthetase
MIEAVLRESGKNPGVIGTISYRYNDIVRKANNTTPDPILIQSLFSEMKMRGVSDVIMEVSSHALIMDRIEPNDFDMAIFTNLSQDHLDFHNTMEEYFKAKALLFQGLKDTAFAIMNNDDPYGKKLISLTRAKSFTYGLQKKSDYTGTIHSMTISGTTFSVNGTEFKINLVGEHNVYNALTAYASVKVLGIDDDTIGNALGKIENIPGRFERVGEGGDYHVFIDYAHTPDALDHLLDAANSLKRGRIITVFGCGGDRDRKKRPIMGRVVEEKSDIVIVTSDNPRTEDPLAIIEDIKGGLKFSNHQVIPERREAIYRAIEIAQKNDIVLIAGKGHEDYQILGNKVIHFDDREVAGKAMNALGK